MTEPVPHSERLMVHINNTSSGRGFAAGFTTPKPFQRRAWSFVLNFLAMIATLTIIPIGIVLAMHLILPRL